MNSLRFLSLLFIFSGALRADELANLLPQIEASNIQPAAGCVEEQQSCVDRFMGTGKNSPSSICESYQNNNSAFLQRFSDGSVVVNPVAIDEAMEYMEQDEAARAPAGKGNQSDVLRSSEPRTPRGSNRELQQMFTNPSRNPALIRNRENALSTLTSQLREQITQGRPADQLSGQQRFLLAKLSNLNITIDYTDGCEMHPFNASYSGVLNTLNICPMLTHLAPESYLALLAHELGHMVDPCSFFDNYSFSPEVARLRNNENAQKDLLRRQIGQCLTDVPAAERTRFADWATAPSRMANQGITVYRYEADTGGNREIAQKLQQCGVVQSPQNPAPLTYEGTPYLPIISCVSQGQSQSRAPITGITRISAATCDRESTMSETIADYAASSIMARIMSRAPATVPAERRALIPGFYTSVVCGGGSDEGYLSSRERMNLFLQPISIQHAVQCEGSGLEPVCPIPSDLIQ